MDVDQKTFIRIAEALERIEKALEINPPKNASVFTKDEIIAAVKGAVSLTSKAAPIPATRQVSTLTVQSDLKPAVVKEYRGLPKYISFQSVAPSAEVLAKFANGTPAVRPGVIKPPGPKPAPQNITVPLKSKNIPAKKVPQKQPAKQQTKQQTKTPASISAKKPEPKVQASNVQINDLFKSKNQMIVNLDGLEPKLTFPIVARQLWDIRDFSFSFMDKLGACNETNESFDISLANYSPEHRQKINNLGNLMEQRGILAEYISNKETARIKLKAKKDFYMIGGWGGDIVLKHVIKIKDELASRHQIGIWRNVKFKAEASSHMFDSEYDVVVAIDQKFYFIEVKTGNLRLNPNKLKEQHRRQLDAVSGENICHIMCTLNAEKALSMFPETENFKVIDLKHLDTTFDKFLREGIASTKQSSACQSIAVTSTLRSNECECTPVNITDCSDPEAPSPSVKATTTKAANAKTPKERFEIIKEKIIRSSSNKPKTVKSLSHHINSLFPGAILEEETAKLIRALKNADMISIADNKVTYNA